MITDAAGFVTATLIPVLCGMVLTACVVALCFLWISRHFVRVV